MAHVRRHLNRAVATSWNDPLFMAETRRLAELDASSVIGGLVDCASIDTEQADLVHRMLGQMPELVSYCEPPSAASALPVVPMLLHRLRNLIEVESPLNPSRERAVLLLMARLTQASEREPDGTCDAALVPPASSEACDGAGGGDGGGGVRVHPSAQLIARDLMLSSVLLPLLQMAAAESAREAGVLHVALQATLQLLSARALQLTAGQLAAPSDEPALGTTALCALLRALLERLERRERSGEDLLLRATHATVQLLLPRARAAAKERSSWLCVAHEQWSALRWQTQLHVWPLSDRLRVAANEPSMSGAAAGARQEVGQRFARWLWSASRPASTVAALCHLCTAASVPGIPVRKAMPHVLSIGSVTRDEPSQTASEGASAPAVSEHEGARTFVPARPRFPSLDLPPRTPPSEPRD